jgi:serine/threonine protein kinase
MSPEQWTNPLDVGPASDLYALGVVAFEAPLGGSFPPSLDRTFSARSPSALRIVGPTRSSWPTRYAPARS